MKTKLLALSLAGVLALSASAQQSESSYAASMPARKVAFEPTTRNWFITLQGGIDYGFGWNSFKSSGTKEASFSDRMNYSAGIALGKWHNPYFGTRLMLDWNWVTNPYEMKMNGNKNEYVKYHSFNPHFDFLFDVTNYFGAYNPDRVFHLVPFIGVGYQADLFSGFDFKTVGHGVTANAGINFDFQFSPVVTLNIAPSVAASPQNNALAAIAQLRAGLTFNLAPGFNAVEPMDYDLLNTLQSEINSLKSQNAELSKRPVRCPECPEVAPATVVENSYESVVYFRIGSSKIDRNQQINIFNIAEFVKANNTPITVTGYADVKTGSSNYNMQLSEKRARKVADELINKYGVPSELITIDYKGSDVQPYNNNAWNRVVIMKSK